MSAFPLPSEAEARVTALPERCTIGGRVGLLAGGGRFPKLFAEAARRQGREVVCVAIRDHADEDLGRYADRTHWIGLMQFGRAIRHFRRDGVDTAVMAGKIHKVQLFRSWRWLRELPDWRTIRFAWSRRKADNRDDGLLLGLVAEFARDGIRFASALEVCPELLVKTGVLTRKAPTAAQWGDVAFGWALAKEMGRLDVGQSVAVKERAVFAVEAIEGTDEAILRAGRLCRAGGFTVVKVAKPEQDVRFDMPTIGVKTIENLARAGGALLAIEAGRTIVVDEADVVAKADALGLVLVATPDGGPPTAEGKP